MQILKTVILFTGILFAPLSALADTLLIVQSVRDRAGIELRKSITRTVPVRAELVILSDYAEVDLPRLVREEQPAVILTIGEPALKAARKIRGVPVVAVMALSLGANRSIPANVTGIDLRISPERYLKVFKALGLKRVGVEYDPARSGVYLAKAQHAAAQAGVELVLRPVTQPAEGVKQLNGLKGSVTDGLWLVPDASVVTALNLEANGSFSLEQRKPIVSYTKEHLKRGAAISLDLDWVKMGEQAGEITRLLMAGTSSRQIPVQSPREFSLESNPSVLKFLGITAQLDRIFPKER